ncbi:MAG: chitobiase/beta-hexosaminidase C-terminal domain-containing protein [Haliscomenobacter sp.]|nr:chitobiase/beta-hexosaminidase C-terminal domain-containing protein [Haliscomenobacter sp.]
MPILVNDDIQVFRKDTKIELKHYVKGAVIRYTLDGKAPDSLTSPIYTEEGILINKTAVLNAKVYLDGWISSDTLTQQFIEQVLRQIPYVWHSSHIRNIRAKPRCCLMESWAIKTLKVANGWALKRPFLKVMLILTNLSVFQKSLSAP